MENEGKHFSEAAMLYAKHYETVQEMRELFKADLNRFHEAVKAAVTEAVLPMALEEELKDGSRSWWIEDGSESSDVDVPYMWLRRNDPEAVIPGDLHVHVTLENGSDTLKSRVKALRTTMKLPAHCTFSKEGRYFVASIRYGEQAPLAAVVEPIATILRALHESAN